MARYSGGKFTYTGEAASEGMKRVQEYNNTVTVIRAWCDICEAPNINWTTAEERLNDHNEITVKLL
jgi:CDP-glycerol glycerophosphotransferase (TagB/SpsB family)